MPDENFKQALTLVDQLSAEEQVQLLQAILGEIGADASVEMDQETTAALLRTLGKKSPEPASAAADEPALENRENSLAKSDTSSTGENQAEDSSLLARSNLTGAQFLMWTGQQISGEVPLYNVANAFTIMGEIDIQALAKAFELLVAHTDVLRTRIVEQKGVPRQLISDTQAAEFDLVDLSNVDEPEAAYRAWLEERKTKAIALDRKLYDAALIRLSAKRHSWYLAMHHAVTDATSADLLFQRLADYYEAAVRDVIHTIPLPPQFEEFVAYERSIRNTARYQKATGYWAEKLEQTLDPIEFYGQSPSRATLRSERVVFPLGAERSSELRAISREGGFATPSSDLSLFAAFATVLLATLHRLTGQFEQRIGTLYDGRQTSTFQNTAGLFIEMGVLQVAIEGGDTFESLGRKVLDETLSSLSHLQPGISSAEMNRAVDVVLNYIHAGSSTFAGLPVAREPVDSGYIDADHSLRLWVTDFEASGNFNLIFDMKAAVFGENERVWFVEHFVHVLDELLASPAKGLGDFTLLNPAERQKLLIEFNDTDASYPQRTVVQLFEEQAAQSPDALAAVEGAAAVTYAELNGRANQLAYYLREQGVGPETAVAICMERSLSSLAAIWGVLKAGAAYIPIDPTYPAERIAYMLADAGPPIVLTDNEQTFTAVSDTAQIKTVNLPVLDLTHYPLSNPDTPTQLDDLVYMIYTSGSTGRPKGTMLTHRGLLNYAWWARGAYQDDGPLTFPLYSSLAFDLTVTSIFVPLLSGGSIVIYGQSAEAPGLEILDVIRDDRVDIVKLTPAHLALVREFDLSNMRIRKLIVGGEDFKTALALDIHHLFHGKVDIYNEYGPTETVVGCMIHRYDPSSDRGPSVPIGTPAANARIYLLDEYDQPVPLGVVGEMVISSDGVARGYHNQPDLTAERFGSDPFRPGARIYHSGDIARWNDQGHMVFLGRRDHQIKLSGARIELGEIESRLQAHPAIHDAVVSVIETEQLPQASSGARCILCGLPSNYPHVSFDDQGVCNLCRDFDRFRDDVFQYFKTMDDLHLLVDKAKAESSGEYDCMMLYSGGKDSTYVLSQLVEMGLKVLAFSLDNGYISEEAKENIRQVTSHLGVELVFATTPHMNAIFADSLEHHSNVCQGCYKVIYTLSMNLARQKGIKLIFTGLSRGQLFETRLDELFRNRMFEVSQMDTAVLEARKIYHHVDDAVHRLLDVSIFNDDRVFEEIQFVDFFRYTDVELSEVYAFLSSRVPWMRPRDTGRSTNCLINEAGIFVHQTERGYHNYALPYSWDVRLGHKTREEALEELDDDLRLPMVQQMLHEVGYTLKTPTVARQEKRLAAYYVTDDATLDAADLRLFLSETLPAHMIPTYLIPIETLPLTPNGKVNRKQLPHPTEDMLDRQAAYVGPQTELEIRLAAMWSETLGIEQIGVHDSFFDIGGASIPAVQVVARISDEFDVAFTVGNFFEHPTIAEQGQILEELLIAQLEDLSDEEAAALLAELEE